MSETATVTFQHPSSLCPVSYDTIQRAIEETDSDPFEMSIVDQDEANAVAAVVNQGIDSHLEAVCGDIHQGKRSITATEDTDHWKSGDELILARTLEGSIPSQFLPTLIRRLAELDSPYCDAATSLASDILYVLGINDTGLFVGREALGLD
jgi:hypothetical protein